MMRVLVAGLLSCLVVSCTVATRQPSNLATQQPFEPCHLRDLAARCGTITVPENRDIRGGRTIDLNVAVVPSGKRHSDAIFVLAGGPGVGATNMAGFVSRTFAGSERDLVLVDSRGTGQSNPLRCKFPGSETDVAGYFGDLFPSQHLAACRTELSARADLTQYTTARIVEDLEHVRRTLGYAKVDLYGTSYGTRVAIEYMRRYPRRVRTAILDGIVPPTAVNPSWYARDAQRSLEQVLDLCLADAACRAAFPGIRADYTAVMAAAEKGVEITVGEAKTRARLDRDFFGENLRNFLYNPDVYRRLPLALHAAAHGDWTTFGDMAYRYARNIRGLDSGLFLSVTCTEDIPYLDVAAARREAAGTFLGSYRVDQQVEACRFWPRGTAPASSRQPLRSSIPTLIVSGEYDPVTPPRFGEEVARTLTRVHHLVIPYGSHSGDTGGCQEKVLTEFVREGSVAALNRSCIDALKPPSFVTK